MQQHGTYLQPDAAPRITTALFFVYISLCFSVFGLLSFPFGYFGSVFWSVSVFFPYCFFFFFRLGVVGMRGAATGFHDWLCTRCVLVSPLVRGVAPRSRAGRARGRSAATESTRLALVNVWRSAPSRRSLFPG